MARNYSSISEPKTLTTNVSSVATQITLNNITGLPSVPYVLVLNPDTANEEAVLVTTDQTGVTAPTLKISRSIETGASAKTHTAGDTVKHMIVGTDLQIVHDHFSATTGVHGIAGALAPIASPTFTGTVVLPSATSIGNVSATEIGYVDGVTSSIQTQFTNNTPVGVVNMWVTGTAPTGWLLCDGSTKSTTTNPELANLYAVIGTTYGGTGATSFRLPDLRGRIPMGAGTGNQYDSSKVDTGDLSARTLGDYVSNAETHTLTAAEIPGHTHPNALTGTTTFASSGHAHVVYTDGTMSYHMGNGIYYTEGNTIPDVGAVNTVGPSGGGTASVGLTNNANTGGGGAHNNVQPSTVINFIIKF